MMPGSMVGRSGLLDELGRAWAALLAGGQPGLRAVVITGEAGMGKSMLVATALATLSPRPRAVLSGAARVHSPAPYDWLAAVLTGRDPGDLPVPGPALAWLAQHPEVPRERYAPGTLLRLAVRTVRGLVGAAVGDGSARDHAAHDHAAGDGAARRPVVLVAEDLHALDPASLNLLGELASVADLGALLLVTSRPPADAVSPALVARTLARLSGTVGATRQHLGPLRQAEVDAILARAYPHASLPPEVTRAVWTRTGGNPYWVSELLAIAGAGAGAGADDPAALATAPLPAHLSLVRSGEPSPAGRSRQVGGPSSPGLPAPGGSPAAGGSVGVPAARRTPLEREVDPPATASELTGREVDVLHCLATGMSNKQIARSLGISVRTVTVHVSNLLRKTGSASRTEAALWAVRHDLAPTPG
jgi:DNA-binding CsgD family transcriptional regulator